jgi:DNA helicase II / ATP-dependent DNA helicase PcrA
MPSLRHPHASGVENHDGDLEALSLVGRMNLGFTPRPSQSRILEYSGGMLGVAAVPGSGKTHTLSALAAHLIAQGKLGAGQEILIVTLVNSAVENFTARLLAFAGEMDLIPELGHRIRTLHGLAHDIVRENPPLAGLDKQFTIVDEAASTAMIRDAARSWAQAHPEVRDAYVRGDFTEQRMFDIADRLWPELIETVAGSFIRAAKDRRLSPWELEQQLATQPADLPLARMGIEIYTAYQKALAYRGAVDFDDLIRLAAGMLDASAELLERLRFRWPYILEDEAQDSSQLQQHILSALAGPGGNWVRVGDPNQAIFETFTTADPDLLREFIKLNPNVPMPESGRCQRSIMQLANRLIEWTTSSHPVEAVRSALSVPEIIGVPPGDPQPNPPEDPTGVHFVSAALTPDEEIQVAVKSIRDWLPNHLDATVAVLASTNDHAANMVRALQARSIPCRELLRSTSPTRAVAGSLSHALACLADPGSPAKLAKAYRVWRRDWRSDKNQEKVVRRVAAELGRIRRVEDYFSPGIVEDISNRRAVPSEPSSSPPHGLSDEEQAAITSELEAFRRIAARWQQATVLPIDQLVLALAQDIFVSSAELALAHKLALVMGQLAAENSHWRLPELMPHLNQIARNKRKFIGFSADDTGFVPDDHKGEVVVATLHKAKGLEWDRVYLISVNDYDFPAGMPGDVYVSEKWFIRDGLNLEAEALAQLGAIGLRPKSEPHVEGAGTKRARLEYARERVRLLFVGITRARKELILISNTGRRGNARPAVALVALEDWWDRVHPAAASSN